jgi:hypothetical protein
LPRFSKGETERIRKRVEAEDVVSTLRPYLNLQRPSEDGTRTTYTVKFLQEPHRMRDRLWREHLYVHVQLMHNAGGQGAGKYTLDLIKVKLQQKLLPLSPLEGKTFAITNLGRPFAKKYYDYDVKRV